MKVLHLSTSDIEGGAARAAYRLHRGLINEKNVDSQMLVRAKGSLDDRVIAKQDFLTKLGPMANSLPLKLFRNKPNTLFSTQWLYDTVAKSAKQIDPQVINLHWICNGFLKIENVAKLNKPLVWTLHDMWTFTGGCHTTRDCSLYKESCGNCFYLGSKSERDLSKWVWQRKRKSWQKLDITFVSPSQWLSNCSTSSSLLQDFKIKIIPHGLELQKYRPRPKVFARETLDLPPNKLLIGFGSGSIKDLNKGFDLLRQATKKLLVENFWNKQVELIVFGSSKSKIADDLKCQVCFLGRFHDDISLSLIYSALDVMVVPSLQEAFGQTASESLACGIPVVAFNATGLKDIVDHKLNGYLAQPYEVEDLARGIAWVLEDEDRHRKLRIEARKKAEREFSLEVQAKRYLGLYEEILNDRNSVY